LGSSHTTDDAETPEHEQSDQHRAKDAADAPRLPGKVSCDSDSAVLDAERNRRDQPNAPEMIAIVAASLHEPPSVVASGISHVDPQNRIVLSDIQDGLDWYAKNGMIKGRIDAAALIEERFVIFAE
jgi:hypothetical protein